MSLSRRMPKQLSSQDDVVYNILTRLPVKSLMQFRCVSKSWNSIITSPIFITTHFNFNRTKSLSNISNNNHNGFMLYVGPSPRNKYHPSSREDLCTVVCNSDRTLTEISRFEIPFSHVQMVGFCNGIFCFYTFEGYKYRDHIIYLWNPSIRKFKKLPGTFLTDPLFNGPFRIHAVGLAYHSQNNDFKILRIFSYNKPVCQESCVFNSKSIGQKKMPPAKAEVYTFSTDSWREVEISVESLSGSIDSLSGAPCLFFNGALHSIAHSGDYHFILSFDVNDEIFREIMLPQNYLLDAASPFKESLEVFKKSLAFMVCYEDPDDDTDKCHLWVMREYGVVESWTKTCLPVTVLNFYGCTDNGELLIGGFDDNFISYDPESLNKNDLGIRHPRWLGYTAGLMESLVLLDQRNEAKMKPAPPLCHERNPREATNTYSYARPLREKYPSLPSWEVQVTNDSGEGETMIVPRKYPNVPWTGGLVDADFVEECYSLIGSMKNWIWSSSQSSFARQNKLSHESDKLSHENDKLSHENDLLRNRVESQASIIRTLERCIWSFGPREAGGSSDPIPDAAGGVTPSPAGECNPMNTILQSKEDSSRLMKRLAPKHPSRRQVREGTTLATIRPKSGDLPSGEQITRDDDEEGKEDTTPFVERQSKRGRL